MKSDFKKIFFSSLLTVLFIVSNLIGLKYTSFGEMLVSVNFITYPFIMLCLLILMDKYGKKETYYTIISTIFIQIFALLTYSFVVNSNSQQVLPDLSNSINNVFGVNEVSMLVSMIAFIISNYIFIYLFDFFKRNAKRIIGVILGTFFSLIVYGLIYNVVCYYGIEKEILINLIISHVFISGVMSIIVIVLFYILKEKDCIYTIDDKELVNINYENVQENLDKTVLEVITLKEKDKLLDSKSNKSKKVKVKTKQSDETINVNKSQNKDSNSNKKTNIKGKNNKNKDK